MDAAERALREGPIFLTSGGTETHLLFQQGFALRQACAFEIFDDAGAWSALERAYLRPILDAAHHAHHGVILDALVWRAHADYVEALGYPREDVERFNRSAVHHLRESVGCWRIERPERRMQPVLLAADLGPRGDGYRAADADIPPARAEGYHRRQIEILAAAGVDVLSAITMTSVPETIGLVRAAATTGLPIVISPTVEVDGCVPDGTSLGRFIERVDHETGGAPVFYMVNCAHPSHLRPTLDSARERGEGWLERFRGFRANASAKSHEDLDESTDLDRGDPAALAADVASMQAAYDLRVVGGCCGTDAEHIAKIAAAVGGKERSLGGTEVS